MKAQEANSLRQENQALMQENERYRGLIETLLRHPSFQPFLEQVSQDPSSIMPPVQNQSQQQHQPQQSATPAPQPSQSQPRQHAQQDVKPEFMNFDASQLRIPQQQQTQPEQHQVGLAMIPEHDMSKLNINGFNAVNFNFNQVNAYAVTDLPCPDPVDLLTNSPVCLPRSVSAASSTGLLSTTDSPADMNVLLAKLDKAARNLEPTHLFATTTQ